jgi:DNA-directed RNA polymerase specialized sigma24 family protein
VKSRNQPKDKTTMTIHLIHHADVTRPIKTTLRSFGVPKQDLEDGVAEVQTRTLEHLQGKALPEGIEQWVALCTTIARNWRLNEKEKRKTEQKYCTGLCEEPDNYVGIEPRVDRPDDVDARRMVAVLQQMFDAGEMPEKGDEILDCVQAGMTGPETATELGITLDAVRWRLDRMRDAFERRLATLGLTGMMLLLVLLAAGPASAASLAPPPSPTEHVPVPPPRIAGVGAAPRAA